VLTEGDKAPAFTLPDQNGEKVKLSDLKGLAEKYGTWVEKSMYGRRYMAVARATFIIDPKGKIARVLPKVQPKKHDDLVLKALSELAAP
jgi:peroxiredoxin Q/BCP